MKALLTEFSMACKMLCSDENCTKNAKRFLTGYFVGFPFVVPMQLGWRLAGGIWQSVAWLCMMRRCRFAALLGCDGRCGPKGGERAAGQLQH